MLTSITIFASDIKKAFLKQSKKQQICTLQNKLTEVRRHNSLLRQEMSRLSRQKPISISNIRKQQIKAIA